MSSAHTLLVMLAFAPAALALTPVEREKLPPPAGHQVDFAREIQPLLEGSCVKCHAKGKAKGGLSLETRAALFKGGETGTAVEPGHSAESLIVEMVSGLDPEMLMPKKGSRWTPEQVGLLRAWIDQGAVWPAEITFARPEPHNLLSRAVALPESSEPHPVDRLLSLYFAAHAITPAQAVDDARFARRAYLDAIGLLPTPEQLAAFVEDPAADKRAGLVRRLLSDGRGYADHWLTFWNDLLRNDFRGTGFIDGGRRQITEWLYNALINDKPYDRFVAELINPNDQSLGFTAGIIWRGTVPAVMAPPMQAAQSVSQVFMGINLKCASCHDSFVNDWSLADAYGMAAIYADAPMELIHCDKPTGQQAAVRFLYPALGEISAQASRSERLQRLADVLTGPKDGRLNRTLVNRLWARLFGRSLVEPLDDMDQPAWSPELLDWLAEDFAAHGSSVRHLLETIMTSRAYQMPAVDTPPPTESYVFRGPLTRRLSAEQFADAISALTDRWASLPATLEVDLTGEGRAGVFQMPRWIWTGELLSAAPQRIAARAVKTASAAAEAAAAKYQALADHADPAAPGALQQAQAAAERAAATLQWAAGYDEVARHKVVFRKHFTLPDKPKVAYAVSLATQTQEVSVNGSVAKSKMADGARNNRVRLYDLAPYLQVGENVVVVSVDSHTEKQMNETEARQFPASQNHLNQAPGFAFYLRARCAERPVEVVSNESWRARRAPEGRPSSSKAEDQDWAMAVPVPAEHLPVDEGPGLEPIRRRDFANEPVPLAPALRAAASAAAVSERVRASLLFADPLQTALDRPNREIVTPARPTAATTLQALELTNGATLSGMMASGAAALAQQPMETAPLVERLYRHALSRPPNAAELEIAAAVCGPEAKAETIADLLWALVLLPEFQFIE